MYPNTSLINAAKSFTFRFKVFLSVENKHYFCHEIHFVNFNLAPDCTSITYAGQHAHNNPEPQ